MVGVVPSAVGKVDPANERDIPRRIVTTADDEQLLVVRAEHSDALIQKHFSAGVVDLAAKKLVGSAAHRSRYPLSMGSPDKAPHFHPRACQPR
ncbi:hypothetical protein AHiyo8_25020 [Arthrobacter sp. Hiyo8]|nr:hypothetical protein AHiyo8_25020 [Arthrobacter sp. Hiyo8]